MSFTLTIRTANAAFSEGYDEGETGGAELARILRSLADHIEDDSRAEGSDAGGRLMDYNGNAVGEWVWTA